MLRKTNHGNSQRLLS